MLYVLTSCDGNLILNIFGTNWLTYCFAKANLDSIFMFPNTIKKHFQFELICLNIENRNEKWQIIKKHKLTMVLLHESLYLQV